MFRISCVCQKNDFAELRAYSFALYLLRKNGVCFLLDKGAFQEEAEGGKEERAGGYREAPPGRAAVESPFLF